MWLVTVVVVSGTEEADILVYPLGQVPWMFSRSALLGSLKTPLVNGQTPSPWGWAPSACRRGGYGWCTTHLVDVGHRWERVFRCQNDWKTLLIKYPGMHKQTQTMMHCLAENAGSTYPPRHLETILKAFHHAAGNSTPCGTGRGFMWLDLSSSFLDRKASTGNIKPFHKPRSGWRSLVFSSIVRLV